MVRAVLINENSPEKEFPISFTSILVAFLIADDPISRWFQDYVQQAGVAVDAILADNNKNLDPQKLEEVSKRGIPEEVLKSLSQQKKTASAKGFLNVAYDYLHTVSDQKQGNLLDVRHLMGAYIYSSSHFEELKKWNLNKYDPDWSNAFLEKIQELFPDEYDGWAKIHLSKFNSPPNVGGLSTYIARDRWTVDDALGYDVYAYAISKFLTHPETKQPLTISIQAPWGGGKTSLMRMIQQELDPEALKSYREQESKDEGASKEKRTKNKLTLGDVRDELKNLDQEYTNFEIAPEKNIKAITIWFNAWKYESTEQVWAGLDDEIIRQYVDHLEKPIDREKFWFSLHMHRLDADKIRLRIYNRIWTLWSRSMYIWLIGFLALIISFITIAIVQINPLIQQASLSGAALSLLLVIGKAVLNYKRINKEPAVITLSEYAQIPDYRANLGFVHNVDKDMKYMFDIISTDLPLVIFIDDLDRCSPEKVAEVVEAVNLFLAGDYKNCFFVLGMDPDIIAAALEVAHSSVIDKLFELNPSTKGTPIGWRFMDKFVQLPFVIPPVENVDLENYTKSLLLQNRKKDTIENDVIEAAIKEVPEKADNKKVDEWLQEFTRNRNFSDNQKQKLRRSVEQWNTFRYMDRKIKIYSDQSTELLQMVLEMGPEFSRNPRDLKRFFNMTRFRFFLKSAREGRGRPSPSNKQLQRWILLSLKWPGFVRWLRSSYGSNKDETQKDKEVPATFYLIKQLEDIGNESENIEEWKSAAKEKLHLDAEKMLWIADEDLFKFFKREANNEERLSHAAGKGFW